MSERIAFKAAFKEAIEHVTRNRYKTENKMREEININAMAEKFSKIPKQDREHLIGTLFNWGCITEKQKIGLIAACDVHEIKIGMTCSDEASNSEAPNSSEQDESKAVCRLEAMIEAFHAGKFELPNKSNSEHVNYDDMPEDGVYAHLQSHGSEWKNGDECEHGHHNYSGANKMTYIGAHPFVNGKHICLSELKGLVIVDSMWLRKPETESQRLERERLEAAYHLVCIAAASDCYGEVFTLDSFKANKDAVNRWLAIVDETKYTKGK